MLIEFRVENHRSIRTEQALSMEVALGGSPEDARPRTAAGHDKQLLTVAALYGANASGKSNVLSAIKYMFSAVLLSARAWDPEGGVRRSPFAWNGMSEEPTLFEVTFLVDGIKYRYGFTVNDQEVAEEWLEAWPKKHKQLWFRRDGSAYKFGDHLLGNRAVVKETTRANALFLSNAGQLGLEQLSPILNWFRSAGFQSMSSDSRPMSARWMSDLREMLNAEAKDTHQAVLFEEGAASKSPSLASLLSLLSAADFDITGVEFDKDGGSSFFGSSSIFRQRHKRILVEHRHGSNSAFLPLEEESDGTQAVFRNGPMILAVLERGGLLVVDELETSLHPLLARLIVDLFNEPSSNPHNAQIIFSTHDSILLGTTMGMPALRRDQAWLAEKDEAGATSLIPLSDYKPRKGENLEKGLLQGRYGGIPYVRGFSALTPGAQGEVHGA